jgi:ubiquinone/menaquinone biosynthesis C-methylase UbiE
MGTKSYRAIAEYYDPENERLPWLQHDVPFFLKQLPKKRQSVLELCAGTARAAIPIAQAGHRVVGVDYAKDMLDIARRKRDAVGLRERELELLHGDALKLKLGRRFDWVICLFNSFMGFVTLPQQDAFLATVRRHMKPRGRFWLDIFQPNLPLLAAEESKGLTPTIFYVPRYDRTVFMTVDVRRDPSRQLQRITFNYSWFDSHGRQRRQRTIFDGTFLFPRELQLLLERNGLRIERLYGDHDGSGLGADSPRMIARCCLA